MTREPISDTVSGTASELAAGTQAVYGTAPLTSDSGYIQWRLDQIERTLSQIRESATRKSMDWGLVCFGTVGAVIGFIVGVSV